MARVEVDPEAVSAPDRLERLPGGDEVVGDFGGVYLETEAHPLLVEHVDDRPPALGELFVPAFELGEVVRGEGVEQVPHGRAGEAVHLRDPQAGGGAGRVLHALGRPLPDSFGLAVAPYVRREDRPVALVDRIADGLA